MHGAQLVPHCSRKSAAERREEGYNRPVIVNGEMSAIEAARMKEMASKRKRRSEVQEGRPKVVLGSRQ